MTAEQSKAQQTVDFHLKSTWHAITRMYNAYAMPFDMTMSIGYILLNIDKNGTPATKIAPALGMEPRSLTRTLKSLEDKGWIIRIADEFDKRVVNVFLTGEGKRQRILAREAVIHFNDAVISKVGQERFSALIETLKDINIVIENEAVTMNQSISEVKKKVF